MRRARQIKPTTALIWNQNHAPERHEARDPVSGSRHPDPCVHWANGSPVASCLLSSQVCSSDLPVLAWGTLFISRDATSYECSVLPSGCSCWLNAAGGLDAHHSFWRKPKPDTPILPDYVAGYIGYWRSICPQPCSLHRGCSGANIITSCARTWLYQSVSGFSLVRVQAIHQHGIFVEIILTRPLTQCPVQVLRLPSCPLPAII